MVYWWTCVGRGRVRRAPEVTLLQITLLLLQYIHTLSDESAPSLLLVKKDARLAKIRRSDFKWLLCPVILKVRIKYLQEVRPVSVESSN